MPVTINGATGITTPDLESTGPIIGTTGAFSGNVTANGLATELRPLVLMTAVGASGTAIDFTGIPSWAKKVTVIFNVASLSGASSFLVQLGAGSLTTTGYVSVSSGTNNSNLTSTAGMVAAIGTAAASIVGHMVITSLGVSNTWVSSHQMALSGGPAVIGGASITLGGVLDRLRITSVNGTDTFDFGSFNVMYE